MLIEGEVDGIMAGGGVSDDSRIRPLIPNAKQAALDWYSRNGVVPINHMVAVRRELAQSRPDVVRELYRMLQDARRTGEKKPAGADGVDLQPCGFKPVWPAVEMIARFATEQQLVPERYPVEKLFGPVLQALA
jgi:4,5-dihydroxyphthalate decarboxylase